MSFDESDGVLLDLDPEPIVAPIQRKLNRAQLTARFILANPNAFQSTRESRDCRGERSTSVSDSPTSR